VIIYGVRRRLAPRTEAAITDSNDYLNMFTVIKTVNRQARSASESGLQAEILRAFSSSKSRQMHIPLNPFALVATERIVNYGSGGLRDNHDVLQTRHMSCQCCAQTEARFKIKG
jgi:hypothetical protein